jgi:RimJ/RimL family protein N-acetyltransferase
VPTRAAAVRILAGHPEVTYAEGYPSAFVVQLLGMLAHYPPDLPPGDGGLGPWIAFRRADNAVVGAVSCALVHEGPVCSSSVTEGFESASGNPGWACAVTVGYDVAPACEGRGYATEMVRLVCAHLLAQPGIARVCADTEVGHTASRRVMEKAGLTWRRDETHVRDGVATVIVHYARDGAEA